MKSETTKQLIILAGVALAALVIWEIFKTIQAGLKAGEDWFSKILMSPFKGLASAWDAIAGFFSFGSDGPQVTDADTLGILGLNGLPITADNSLGSLLLGNPQTTSSLPNNWDWTQFQ